MNRSARALQATAVVSAFGYAGQLISLFSIPVFLSTLGTDGYGAMLVALSFMSYLGFADAGLSSGAMVMMAHANGRDDRGQIAHIVRHAAGLALLSGVVILCVVVGMLLFARAGLRLPMFASDPANDRLVGIVAAQMILTLQHSVFYNLFHALQEGYWPAFYQGMGRLAGAGLGLAAAWVWQKPEAVLIAQLMCTAVTGTLCALHAWRAHPWAFRAGTWTERQQFVAQGRIGAKTSLVQLGRTLSGTAPTMAISSLLGAGAVPFYTIPFTLLTLGFTPFATWVANLQGAFGEAFSRGAVDWLRASFRRTIEITLLGGALGVAIFLAAGDRFVELWTHQRIGIASEVALAVSALVFLSTVASQGQTLLVSLNRHRRSAIAETLQGVASLVIVPLSVRWLGVAGGAVGSALCVSVFLGPVLFRECRHHLGAAGLPAVSFLARVGVVGLVTYAGAWVAMEGLRSGGAGEVVTLIATAVAAVVMYGGAACALRLLSVADLQGLLQRITAVLSPVRTPRHS